MNGPVELRLSASASRPRLDYIAGHLLEYCGLPAPATRPADGEAGLWAAGRLLVPEPELLRLFDRISLNDEIQSGRRDRLGRFDETWAPADADAPIVDMAAAHLAGQAAALGLPARSASRGFRVVVTHDIDWLTAREPHAWLASLSGLLVGGGHRFPRRALWDPDALLTNLEGILALEREQGVVPWVFLLPGPHRLGLHTCRYDPSSKLGRRLVSLLKEHGADIGLHGSFSAGRQNAYSREASALASLTGGPVRLHRQHYLRFDPVQFWSRLESAGIATDSSVGYRTRPGFRAGTARPYHPYDFTREAPSSIVEVPLVYMDRLDHARDPEGPLSALTSVLERTREAGGTVAILFHPENMVKVPGLNGLFRRSIDLCLSMGADLGAASAAVQSPFLSKGCDHG